MSFLVKNSFIYILSTSIPSLGSFLLMPFYLKFITLDDLGYFSVFLMINTFLTVFGTMQLHSSIVKFFIVHNSNKFKQRQYLMSLLVVSIFISIGVLIILYFFLNQIKVIFELEKLSDELVFLALFIGLLNGYKVLYESISRIIQRANHILIGNILTTICLVVCSYIFLKHYNMTLYGIVLATFVSSIVTLIYYILINMKYFALSVDFSLLKEPFKFAIGLIPHALSKNIYVLSDRLILIKFVSIGDVGIYAVLDKVANILKLLTSNFGKAFTPFFMTNYYSGVKLYLSEMILVTNYIFIGFLMVIVMFLRLILDFIQEGLNAYDYLVIILSIAFIFKNLEMYLTNFLLEKKQTSYVSIISFVASAINISLNLVFIPTYGIVAAATTTTISYFVGFLASYYYVDIKFNYFKFPFFNVLIDFVFGGILIFVIYLLQNIYALIFVALYIFYGYFKYFDVFRDKLIKK